MNLAVGTWCSLTVAFKTCQGLAEVESGEFGHDTKFLGRARRSGPSVSLASNPQRTATESKPILNDLHGLMFQLPMCEVSSACSVAHRNGSVTRQERFTAFS